MLYWFFSREKWKYPEDAERKTIPLGYVAPLVMVFAIPLTIGKTLEIITNIAADPSTANQNFYDGFSVYLGLIFGSILVFAIVHFANWMMSGDPWDKSENSSSASPMLEKTVKKRSTRDPFESLLNYIHSIDGL